MSTRIRLQIDESSNEKNNHRYLRITLTVSKAGLNIIELEGSLSSWLIPVVVFTAISAFSTFTVRNVLFASGLGHDTGAKCDVGSPAHQTWGPMCTFVMAFWAPMEGLLGHTFDYFNYFNVTFVPLYLLILVEANRLRRPLILSIPMITGIVLLVLTAGPIMPLYCLAFVLTGAASAQNSNKEIPEFAISRKNAEAITFGVAVGYVIPSILLAAYQNIPVFVIWFGIHIYMAMFQMIWRVARPDTQQMDSKIIQGLYAVTFVASSVTHIIAVLSRIHDLQELSTFILPPMSSLEPSTTLSPTWHMDLTQWDIWLSQIAVMAASFWFAKDGKERFRLLMWHIAATLTVGPGASVCGALIWREIRLTKKVTRSLTLR